MKMVIFWALRFEKANSYGKTRCHVKNSNSNDTLDVCKFMLELHSNNHLNSLTLNEDTYEKSFEKTGVTENESYGYNSHMTRIF